MKLRTKLVSLGEGRGTRIREKDEIQIVVVVAFERIDAIGWIYILSLFVFRESRPPFHDSLA